MKVFLNGRILPASQARVSVYDHGFLYGDGIYETVRAYHYKIFHWLVHYQRLRQSADRLSLACPWSSTTLERAVVGLLRANRTPEASVRITVSRGEGPLGLDPTLCPKPTLAILLHPTRPAGKFQREGVSIGIARIRRNPPESLDPLIKSNNCLNTILAKMEARSMGVFEAVLLNLAGYLTEGTTTNIFFLRQGVLHTPALACGLLEGVTRNTILSLARWNKFPVREGHYRMAELERADEIFLTSTTLEVVPVVSLAYYKEGTSRLRRTSIRGGRPGPLTGRLHQIFRASVQNELKQ